MSFMREATDDDLSDYGVCICPGTYSRAPIPDGVNLVGLIYVFFCERFLVSDPLLSPLFDLGLVLLTIDFTADLPVNLLDFRRPPLTCIATEGFFPY